MIKNIFVKQQIKDYKGNDMDKFKRYLINKNEGFDQKEILSKIDSAY